MDVDDPSQNDDALPEGLASFTFAHLGTTSGEVWASVDEGEQFTRIAGDLPHIYSVTVGAPA
jgi:hypothetical protein